jgi:hypothetical protein
MHGWDDGASPVPLHLISADEDDKEVTGAIKNIKAIMQDWDVPSYMTVTIIYIPDLCCT